MKEPAIFLRGGEPTQGIHSSPNPKHNLITDITSIKEFPMENPRVPFPPDSINNCSEHKPGDQTGKRIALNTRSQPAIGTLLTHHNGQDITFPAQGKPYGGGKRTGKE